MSSIVFSFFPGTLSVLSPCVLPVLPIIVASALQRGTHGPLALAGGLVVSSTTLGLLFASFDFAIAVDRDVARAASGALMATIGRPLMGVALVLIGVLTVSGGDKVIETWMVDHMPDWLLALTTRL